MPPRPCDHAAEVPAVLPVHVLALPQFQFTNQSARHSSCMLSWLRGGANCAENRRVFASAVRGTPFALCLVRQWIHVLRQLRWVDVFWTCWWFFVLLKSILSCSPVCGRARGRQRQWYVLPGSWLRCTSPCVSFDCCIAWEWRSRTVEASVGIFA